MRQTRKRPLFLGGPFFPAHDKNRMHDEGDVVGARKRFLDKRFRNLEALLSQRYTWMNDYIRPDDQVVEFGCGAGFSRLYLRADNLVLTDYVDQAWVDIRADAMNPPFEPKSIDTIICSHMIHHMAQPTLFFRKVRPLLRDRGRIIIQDLNTALTMRILLWVMRHEGWSYDIDVFDENSVANDPNDPWSANCAIPQLLFESSGGAGRQTGPGSRPQKRNLMSVFSGGVISRTSVRRCRAFKRAARFAQRPGRSEE
ncbi:MAG: class I SAM-dependent methyltransferase [Sphingomonadales bacterium]|nr:class I SAM-dependent methyltransferase [Sphingomonadales bacterium]